MHIAQVTTYGEPPKCVEVADLPAPNPADEEIRVKIIASGVHRVVRSKATGNHYSAGALPHLPGIDGVGETEDGQKVYFVSFYAGATFADYINIPWRNTIPLPDGLDPTQAAAMANPATSSWMALHERTADLRPDFTVLILGVTSASGAVAIPLARAAGAKRVIGAARNAEAAASLGLDDFITINASDATKTDFSALGDVDVVLDYVYGPLALHLFSSLKSRTPVQYVHIGSVSGVMDISVPSAVLRSKDLTIRGSGPGSFDPGRAMRKHLPTLLQAMVTVPHQKVNVKPLSEIEKAWNEEGEGRLVFTP